MSNFGNPPAEPKVYLGLIIVNEYNMRMRKKIGLLLLVVLLGFVIAVWAYNRYVRYPSPLNAWAPSSGRKPYSGLWKPKNPDVIRILSLDGGGVRGLVSLEVLKSIEKKSGKPIAQLFDIVAGTSSGAIIATLLLLPGEQGQPRYSAESIIDRYTELVSRTFSAPWYHQLLTLNGTLGPRFLNHTKIVIANRLYGRATLGDLLLPVLIPSYSLTDSRLHLFTNWLPQHINLRVAALIVAATSPPSVFPAVELRGASKEAGEYVDGAILATDPAYLAFSQSLGKNPQARFVIVSVGTGLPNDKVAPRVGIYGGGLDWIESILHIMLDGQAQLTSSMLKEFSEAGAPIKMDYYRFNTQRPVGLGDWLNASPENIEALKDLGKDIVKKQNRQLDEAIELLLRN